MLVAEMAKVRAIRTIIIGQLPRDDRFTAADGAVLARHKTFLTDLGEPLIRGFCESHLAVPALQSTGDDGPPPVIEETLRDFWYRLIASPIDRRFWDWMTLVGLEHTVRKVRKPTMITAWSWIACFVSIEAAAALPAQEALRLQVAFGRLGTTLAALVSESYLAHYQVAINEIADPNQGPLQAMLDRAIAPAPAEF
jgi:hypothetical protein